MRILTLDNIKQELYKGMVCPKDRIYGKKKQYKLLTDVYVQLSNNELIKIHNGFEWDLSSVPRILWFILPPDGDFEIAALIHDYLYRSGKYSRKFADKEMLKWSRVSNSSNIFNRIDNNVRYIGVRAFGWYMYNKRN